MGQLILPPFRPRSNSLEQRFFCFEDKQEQKRENKPKEKENKKRKRTFFKATLDDAKRPRSKSMAIRNVIYNVEEDVKDVRPASVPNDLKFDIHCLDDVIREELKDGVTEKECAEKLKAHDEKINAQCSYPDFGFVYDPNSSIEWLRDEAFKDLNTTTQLKPSTKEKLHDFILNSCDDEEKFDLNDDPFLKDWEKRMEKESDWSNNF